MSSAKQVVSNAFESSASERLARFIAGQGIAGLEITPLTPDASTRKYFRIPWKKGKAVAAVYPEPFDPELERGLPAGGLDRRLRLGVPGEPREHFLAARLIREVRAGIDKRNAIVLRRV